MSHDFPAKESTTHVSFSFEFYPPKSAIGVEKLWETAKRLATLRPKFVSVTCGAGGSAIDGTAAIVHHIYKQFRLDVIPHVAMARQSRERIRTALQDYKNVGIHGILAVRGDSSIASDNLTVHDTYSSTIDFVAELKNEFGLEPIVAAYPDVHPHALSPQEDLDYLRRKADAGATLAISQFFFLPETFLRFRDKVQEAGIKVPLVPGIITIQNFAQTIKFAEKCGTIVPDGFAKRFERHGDDSAALFDEGVDHATEVCETLHREGVDHFHFYTLNSSEMTEAVCTNQSISRPIFSLTGPVNGGLVP